MDQSEDSWAKLPSDRRRAVEQVLAAGERPRAWVETDLDERLYFAAGLVVLTDHRLISVGPDGQIDTNSLAADHVLKTSESVGVGALELTSPTGRVGVWRYTMGHADAARRMARIHESARTGIPPPATSVCPVCGAVMPGDGGRCSACARTETTRPVAALLRLLPFARPHAAQIALGFLLTLAGTSAGLVPPYLTMPLLDRVLIPHQNGQPADFGLVPWYLAGLAGAAVMAWLLDWARAFVSARVSERVAADLRSRAYAHLQSLSMEYFGGKRTGDLISRVSSDTDRICNFLSMHLVDFATDVLMISLTAVVMLSISPSLAAAALVPFPVIMLLVYRARGRFLRGYRQSSGSWAELTSVLADTIPGIRVVKAFAQESREIERFDTANERVLTANNRVNLVWSFFGPVVTLLTTSGLLIVWGVAAWLVFHGSITVGILTAFLAYITRFYTRSESMIRIFSTTQRAAASAQRVFEILDRVPTVPEPAEPIVPDRITGRVELDGVRFRYGAREVLHGLDLDIRPGEMIGLVGHSGAGKSTLVNLVCRFYDVAQGAIRVDGIDVRRFPVAAYRRHIGIVLQEPFLFFGTVAENIAYGRPDTPRDAIIAAARAARAHEFIMRLPDGYDSLVGERGQALSGGERQRISIARALLIDPRILILDEATASVDTETEREIQTALETLTQGRTTIAIAHRLSTLRRADRIVVLEQGRIVEIGTHAELLRQRGAYARLHKAQVELAQGHAV